MKRIRMNYLKTISLSLAMVVLLLGVLPPCTAKRKSGSRKSSSSQDCQVKAALQEMRDEILSLTSEVKQLKDQISVTCGIGAHNGPQADKPISDDVTTSEGSPLRFECNDGSCINKSLRCNMVVNCPDAEDEVLCYTGGTKVTPTAPADMDHNMDHNMDQGGVDQENQPDPKDVTTEGNVYTTESSTITPTSATSMTSSTTTTTPTPTTSITTTTTSTTTTTTLPPPEGPPPEVPTCIAPYLQVGHSCFYSFTYFKDWRSWGEANAKCKTIGGTLASPWNFLDLQHFLLQRYTTTFWVGIQFNVQNKTWTWLSGKKMAKEFWKPGQPSRGAKRCAYLDYNSNYKAVSHYCGEKFPFICEMKA